jgi:hypothetical protein
MDKFNILKIGLLSFLGFCYSCDSSNQYNSISQQSSISQEDSRLKISDSRKIDERDNLDKRLQYSEKVSNCDLNRDNQYSSEEYTLNERDYLIRVSNLH